MYLLTHTEKINQKILLELFWSNYPITLLYVGMVDDRDIKVSHVTHLHIKTCYF